MTDKHWQERAEKYLLGEMAPEEQAAFTMEMERNPELRSLVQEQRLELDAMDVLVARDLRARMAQWERESPPDGSLRRFWWILPLALGGILILLFFFPKEPPQEVPTAPPKAEQTPAPVPAPVPQEAPPPPAPSGPAAAPQANRETGARPYIALALAYYETPRPNGEWRSTGEPAAASNLYAEALDALGKSRFSEALALIRQMDPSQAESAAFLKGHALFGLKRYREAAGEFRSLTDPPSLSYRDAADWNEVLCLLAVSQRSDRQSLEQRLQTIAADEAHPYRQKALELKNALAEPR